MVCNTSNDLVDLLHYVLILHIFISVISLCFLLLFLYIIRRHINVTYPDAIPLLVHSHRGHLHNDTMYSPQNVLTEEDRYYFSREHVTGEDWIVFSVAENCSWYPIKISIQTYDGRSSVRSFRFYIGSAPEEWTEIESKLFIAKMSNRVQDFYIKIDNEMHQMMQRTPWRHRHFKLQIVDNHGWDHGIYLKHFKVYGVPTRICKI